MTLEDHKKLSKHLFRLLKVNEIIIPIGRTNKGNLGLAFRESSDDFEIMLDSVPLSTSDILKDENNIELKRLLEKYWFDSNAVTLSVVKTIHGDEVAKVAKEFLEKEHGTFLKKKGGRPKGSKDKTKAVNAN